MSGEFKALGSYAGPNIPTSGLVLYLDAGNTKSYPGSGTTWYDLSGNSYNFTVSAGAFNAASGSTAAHFNFEGTYGAATIGSDVPSYANATLICFSSILNSTGNWRTLIRGSSADHQVIIANGSNTLGMYDNNGGNFISSGFDITSLPSPYTKFNCLAWKFSQSSPYYQFAYNGSSFGYAITNANATFNNGFTVVGAYQGGPSQYWGKIGAFIYYNRHLTDSEVVQIYSAYSGRFGL